MITKYCQSQKVRDKLVGQRIRIQQAHDFNQNIITQIYVKNTILAMRLPYNYKHLQSLLYRGVVEIKGLL